MGEIYICEKYQRGLGRRSRAIGDRTALWVFDSRYVALLAAAFRFHGACAALALCRTGIRTPTGAPDACQRRRSLRDALRRPVLGVLRRATQTPERGLARPLRQARGHGALCARSRARLAV